MRDRHKGETCIAIANGPSLADVPNEFLESYITFGANKIWLKEFSPTYYVATDNWMNPYTKQMREMHCKEYFLSSGFAKHLAGSKPTAVVLRDTPESRWKEPGEMNWTVIYTVLQIAHIMGFETVLLVGLDHTGSTTHFHPAYNQWGAKRTYMWDIDGANNSFQIARDEYEKSGRRIINLTPGSKCEIFEKQDIKLWQTHT